MKAIRQHAHGGPESLRYEGAPRPSPRAGEVLVRVRAAGVIPTELLWPTSRTTRSGTPRPLPLIPGHEFSGELAAPREGVGRNKGVGTLIAGGVLALPPVHRRPNLGRNLHCTANPVLSFSRNS
jgi:NADPH:quinone reductase-like Zn-dependent oxidoreductase